MVQELITINVWLAGRTYRIRIHPDEEGAVRAAAKSADEKIVELRQHYAGKDDQDFVAMCLLMYATDSVGNTTSEDHKWSAGIQHLNSLLDSVLDPASPPVK